MSEHVLSREKLPVAVDGRLKIDGIGVDRAEPLQIPHDQPLAFSRGEGGGVIPERIAKYPPNQHSEEQVKDGSLLGRLLKWLETHGYYDQARSLGGCGRGFTQLDCGEEGHTIRKHHFCGKEWCPRCGAGDPQDGDGFVNTKPKSPSHQRRYARVWSRLMWADSLGYVVLTIPEEWRGFFKSAESLKALHRKAWKVVKDVFKAEGGLCVLHFFGDKSGDNYNPHVNVVFPIPDWVRDLDQAKGKDTGLVPPEYLDKLRDAWLEALKGLLPSEADSSIDKKNVKYMFKPTEAQKAHCLRYITRPTCGAGRFLRLDDSMKEFLLSLQRFHNYRWFGILSNSTYRKELEARGVDVDEGGPWDDDKTLQDFVLSHNTWWCPDCKQESPSRICPRCRGDLVWVCPDCGEEFSEQHKVTVSSGDSMKVICDACYGKVWVCPHCGKDSPVSECSELEVWVCPICFEESDTSGECFSERHLEQSFKRERKGWKVVCPQCCGEVWLSLQDSPTSVSSDFECSSDRSLKQIERGVCHKKRKGVCVKKLKCPICDEVMTRRHLSELDESSPDGYSGSWPVLGSYAPRSVCGDILDHDVRRDIVEDIEEGVFPYRWIELEPGSGWYVDVDFFVKLSRKYDEYLSGLSHARDGPDT